MPPRSSRQDPQRLTKLANAHRGVVTREQLSQAGFDSDAIRRRVQGGNWQTAGRTVVLHNGPLDPLTMQWVGVLNIRGLAGLTGRTAAKSFGLRGFEPSAVEIAVPRGTRLPRIPGIVWRETCRFEVTDLVGGRQPPSVRPARAVIDAATRSPSARIACATVAAAVQQRITTVRLLRAELALAGRVKYRRHLNLVLADIEGGADSLAEIDFTRLARRAGLPPPIRQSVRLDRYGRRRYIDVDFGTFVVEVDGGIHLRPMNAWDDARRQNELVLGGERVLRFPTIAIRLEEQIVIEQLALAARVFGYPTCKPANV
ncbi:MAG: DUF559 domain-containing protein [Acidothermaceae bacterium]